MKALSTVNQKTVYSAAGMDYAEVKNDESIKDHIAKYSLMAKFLTIQNVAQLIEIKRSVVTGEPFRNLEVKNFDQISIEEIKEENKSLLP